MVPFDCQPLRGRRLILPVFVLLLGVILPLWIVIGAVSSAFSGWPLGLVMAEQHRVFCGTIKNGELWYPVSKYARSTYSPPCESRVVCLDLMTGKSRETGWTLPQDMGGKRRWKEFDLIWVGDVLYVVDRYASTPTVWKATATGLELYAELPPKNPKSEFFHAPFFWNGELTIVEQIGDGDFRLVRFNNGTWEQGRRIRLPNIHSRWEATPEGPRIISDPELRLSRIHCYLTVIATDAEPHLRIVTALSTNKRIFAAYHKGFEYVDENEIFSNESLESTGPDASGWEQINSSENSAVGGTAVAIDDDSVLLGLRENEQFRFARRRPDGRWTVLSGLEPSTQEFDYDILIAGSSGRSYVCRQSSEWWDRFTFYPIDGGKIGPAELTLPGYEQKYLNRWAKLAGGLLMAWITHVVVVLYSQRCCQASTSNSKIGVHKLAVAPVGLRAVALLIDAIAISALVSISLSVHWSCLGIQWDRNPDHKLSRVLSHAEMNVDSVLSVTDCTSDPHEVIGRPHDLGKFLGLILTVFVDTFVPLWLYRSYDEGKSGLTLGKRLTGIRTRRPTGRACGFARAVVRNAMSVVDFALVTTPLPAAISMMLSSCRQRIGDRVADTLVILACRGF